MRPTRAPASCPFQLDALVIIRLHFPSRFESSSAKARRFGSRIARFASGFKESEVFYVRAPLEEPEPMICRHARLWVGLRLSNSISRRAHPFG